MRPHSIGEMCWACGRCHSWYLTPHRNQVLKLKIARRARITIPRKRKMCIEKEKTAKREEWKLFCWFHALWTHHCVAKCDVTIFCADLMAKDVITRNSEYLLTNCLRNNVISASQKSANRCEYFQGIFPIAKVREIIKPRDIFLLSRVKILNFRK